MKNLESYLDELAWRFNNREDENIFRDILRLVPGSEPLKFKVLIQSMLAPTQL